MQPRDSCDVDLDQLYENARCDTLPPCDIAEAGKALASGMLKVNRLDLFLWMQTLECINRSEERMRQLMGCQAMWAFPVDWPTLFATICTRNGDNVEVKGAKVSVEFNTHFIGQCVDRARRRVDFWIAYGIPAKLVYVRPIIPGSGGVHASLPDGSGKNANHAVVELQGFLQDDYCNVLHNQILFDDPTYLNVTVQLRCFEYVEQLAAQVYGLTGCEQVIVWDECKQYRSLTL